MRKKRLTTSLLKCFCLTTSLVIARENIGSWSKSLLLALLLSIRLPDNHSSTQKLSWSLSSFHDVLRENNTLVLHRSTAYSEPCSSSAPPCHWLLRLEAPQPRVNLGSLGLAACAVAVPCCDEDLAQAHHPPRQLSNTQTDAQFSCLTNPKQYGMRHCNVNSK